MNTFLSRLNTVFAFTLTVLAALTFLCFLTTAFNDYKAPLFVKAHKMIVKDVQDFSVSRDKNDLGFVTFDLQADLHQLFNWNTKQLFLYLRAEYATKKNTLNQVVLWDKIVLRGDNSFLNYISMNTKYYFFDDGHGLKGNNNITLYVSWNVIPNAGYLPQITGDRSDNFAFPEIYTPNRPNM